MEKIYNDIISFLREYQQDTNCKGYVIGVSGGKDSTVVAKLLCDAIGKANILGVLMPNGNQKDIGYSHAVCAELGIDHMTVNINDNVYDIRDYIENAWIDDSEGNSKNQYIAVTEQAMFNVPPRIRMTILYAIAQSMGYRVAGTGNKSEAYIGWCTKWGDMASDINPIAHLTCTQVIELGHYLCLPEYMVNKVPADGLTDRSDEDNFGFSYADLDEHIMGTHSEYSDAKVEAEIEKKHRSAHHKSAPYTMNHLWK